MNILNYAPIDENDYVPYLNTNFDIENDPNHNTDKKYEQVVKNLTHLKAQGNIPINESQIYKNNIDKQNSCYYFIQHIQNCHECRAKLENLIISKLPPRTNVSKKFCDNCNCHHCQNQKNQLLQHHQCNGLF